MTAKFPKDFVINFAPKVTNSKLGANFDQPKICKFPKSFVTLMSVEANCPILESTACISCNFY